jgi:hypothetical protein
MRLAAFAGFKEASMETITKSVVVNVLCRAPKLMSGARWILSSFAMMR